MRGKRKKEGVGVAAELRHHCVTKELLETLDGCVRGGLATECHQHYYTTLQI